MTVVACDQEVLPVHGVVAFVPADFRVLYPQFTNPPTTDAMLQNYFLLATLVLNNSCGSIVSDANEREQLLNLLVAHIATLVPIQPAAGAGSGVVIVGPVSSAAEGSVSISSGYAARVANNEAWFAQTQYGFLFWQLVRQYTTMHYVAPAQCCGPAGAWPGRRY
jgi:hypothetical protein